MKPLFTLLSLILIIVIGCEKNEDQLRESQCNIFSNIDTFSIENNVNELTISTTLMEESPDISGTYSLIYWIENTTETFSVEKGTTGLIRELEFDISEKISCGFSYEFYFVFNTDTWSCRSITFDFKSQLSSIQSPRCYNSASGFPYYFHVFGFEIDNKLYVIESAGFLFQITQPEKTFLSRKQFPVNGNSGTHYTTFSQGSFGYVKSTESPDLYRYQPATNSWSNYGNLPVNSASSSNYYSKVVNGIAYIFNRKYSYTYNIQTRALQNLAIYNL